MSRTLTKTGVVPKRKPVAPKKARVKDVYEEDGCTVIVRIFFRDGAVVEMTADELADDVRQQRIYKESVEKVQKSLESQFLALSKILEEWRQDNAEHLFRCVVAYPEVQQDCSEVYFFAVQNSNEYNEKFSRNLTQLELNIENSEQFNRVNLKVLELPKMDMEQVKEFVNNYISNT